MDVDAHPEEGKEGEDTDVIVKKVSVAQKRVIKFIVAMSET